MSFVRTVLGDIPPTELGVCYAHEHLIIDPSYTTENEPDFLLDDVTRGVSELNDFHAAGGRAIIDAMPGGAGRNALKLADLARQSGVHIVCPTGLHLAKYYPPGHWSTACNEDELAALFIREITASVDANDPRQSNTSPTTHRAGVIKIATENRFTPREEIIFAAAARAHRRTGCPILTHTEQGTLALEQIDRLQRDRVNLQHVCLSHTDRKPDVGYHREILARGVRVEFDSAFRWKPGQGNPTLDLLLALLPEFPDQIMLGMDAARRSYWRSYGGGPGLAFLLTDFSQTLRAAGVTPEMLHRIFVSTPAATFSFAPPRP